jgi:hypothetical protein
MHALLTPKLKCQISNDKLNPNSKFQKFPRTRFDIHLTIACLLEAASAKAGILKFEIFRTWNFDI